MGHKRQGGRLVCPGGLDPPPTTRPRKRSRGLYEDEGSDTDDPLLLKPLSSDEARPPASRKRRVSYQYDRDYYGDQEAQDGRDAPVLSARAREIVVQNMCVREITRTRVRFTSEPAPNLRFLAPAFVPGPAIEAAQDEGTPTESDGAGWYSVHHELTVAGDEQEDGEDDETRTQTGADDHIDELGAAGYEQEDDEDDETRTQTGANDHSDDWRAQGSPRTASQTLQAGSGSRAGSFTGRWVLALGKGKRNARSAPQSDHTATPSRPPSRMPALNYAPSGHEKREHLDLGALPQDIAPRDIREWAASVPNHPSAHHGHHSHADVDDAASQSEFGMPATVPFPPPIVAFPGPNIITLAPSRPASPTLSSASTTDRSSTEDSVRSLDEPLTPAMAAAQAPIHYLERILRAASIPIACICWVPTASAARASLDIARAGLFVSLAYDTHDGVWIVVADTNRKLGWVLAHSAVLVRSSFVAHIGDLPWGAPPAAIEAAIEAAFHAEVPAHPVQLMGGQLGGIVVWCNAQNLLIA